MVEKVSQINIYKDARRKMNPVESLRYTIVDAIDHRRNR